MSRLIVFSDQFMVSTHGSVVPLLMFTPQTIIAGLESVGSIFGENVNKEIAKLVAQVELDQILTFRDFLCRVRGRFSREL